MPIEIRLIVNNHALKTAVVVSDDFHQLIGDWSGSALKWFQLNFYQWNYPRNQKNSQQIKSVVIMKLPIL